MHIKIQELDPAAAFGLLKIRTSMKATRKEAFIALIAAANAASLYNKTQSLTSNRPEQIDDI